MISAKGQWHLGSKPYQNQGSKPSNVLFSFFSASKHHHSKQPLLLFTWYGLIRSSPRCLERLLQLSGGEKNGQLGFGQETSSTVLFDLQIARDPKSIFSVSKLLVHIQPQS
jgi:hypothetical protein